MGRDLLALVCLLGGVSAAVWSDAAGRALAGPGGDHRRLRATLCAAGVAYALIGLLVVADRGRLALAASNLVGTVCMLRWSGSELTLVLSALRRLNVRRRSLPHNSTRAADWTGACRVLDTAMSPPGVRCEIRRFRQESDVGWSAWSPSGNVGVLTVA